MNLYKFHEKPKDLNHHDLTHARVPKMAWKDRMPTEWYKEREDLWAKDTEYAILYARFVLKGPFPKGEDVLAKNAHYSYDYARFVIKQPFPKGEDAIAKDAEYSYLYASNVLRTRFSKGEEAIAKDEMYKHEYEQHFGIKL